MARLEAQSKILYYPTPDEVVDRLATYFTAPQPTRLADPCCGMGAALRRFANNLGGPRSETWGVEISYSRAEEAEKLLDAVLPTSFYRVRYPGLWAPSSVSLMFNNPPYDWSDIVESRKGQQKRLRHELAFVEWSTPKIAPGGHHLIIVPRGVLGDPTLVGQGNQDRLARHLAGWYGQVRLFRFPGDLYQRFKQIVILAVGRLEKYKPPTVERIQTLTRYLDEACPMPELVQNHGQQITIPPTPAPSKFTYVPVSPTAMVKAAQKASPIGTAEYHRATYIRPLGAPFNPAVPLGLGHISMLISGQETGLVTLQGEKGMFVAKGMSRKAVEVSSLSMQDEEGAYSHTKVTEREKHITTLTLAHEDGELEVISTPDGVADFITRYGGDIADVILARNQPSYAWDPNPEEAAVVDRVALGLPPIPGKEERGLFPMQKHFAIAAARVLKKSRHCIMNCEMGFGV